MRYRRTVMMPVSVVSVRKKLEEEKNSTFQYGVAFIAMGLPRVKAEMKLAGPTPRRREIGELRDFWRISKPKVKGRTLRPFLRSEEPSKKTADKMIRNVRNVLTEAPFISLTVR